MVARRTPPSYLRRLNARTTGRGYYTWHTDKFADELRSQVSENARVLVRVNLHLPVGHRIARTARDCLVIIVQVDFLSGSLQDRDESLWVVPHLHAQVFIEVEQQLHVHLDVEATFTSVPLQLLPAKDKSYYNLFNGNDFSSL